MAATLINAGDDFDWAVGAIASTLRTWQCGTEAYFGVLCNKIARCEQQ